MKQIGNYLIDTDLYYEPEHHFWLSPNQGFVRIGFNPLLQETSGAFVAILLDKGKGVLPQGHAFGSVEAEKHVAQLVMPISGEIIVINEQVIQNPRLMNTDPYGEGWLIEVQATNFDQEKQNLIFGEENIEKWVLSEIRKFEDKGWIARP